MYTIYYSRLTLELPLGLYLRRLQCRQKMSKVAVSARIESSWYEKLTEIRRATGQNESEIIREAIALYLERTDPTSVRLLERRVSTLEKKHNQLAKTVHDV